MYVLSNRTRSVLYVGITNDLKSRIEKYKEGAGSIFTKKYKVVDLLYFEEFTDINQAIAREKQLKNWKRAWELDLIKKQNSQMKDLYYDL